jgi:benzodiazapine receptor
MAVALDRIGRKSTGALLVFLALSLVVALAAGAVTRPAIASWYAGLAKPFFTPPNWLFGPAWTVLYILIAVAGWRIWRTPESASRRWALVAYGLQLALNCAWSFLFFGARNPLLGLIDILALEAAILWTLSLFARLDRPAAWLMLPYALWVAYATALNAAILSLN